MVNETSSQNDDTEQKEQQIVYVLTNPAMPGIVKIGQTKDLERRISELSKLTGVPLPFDCVRAVKVNNRHQAESALHTAFSKNRVNPRKEFFEIDPEQAIAILDLIGIEDVTPGQDELGDTDLLDRVASDKFKSQTRRPLLKFIDLNIPQGAELRFTQNDRVTVRVVDDQTAVSYEGDTYPKIAALTKDLLGSQRNVSAQLYWTYEGRLLREMYNEAHPQEVDEP